LPFPEQAEIESPLLEALVELGGEARPRDIYPLVAKRFHLTQEEQEGIAPGSPENSLVESRQLDRNCLTAMMGLLKLGRGQVPQGGE
jgi:hypothetical protein